MVKGPTATQEPFLVVKTQFHHGFLAFLAVEAEILEILVHHEFLAFLVVKTQVHHRFFAFSLRGGKGR